MFILILILMVGCFFSVSGINEYLQSPSVRRILLSVVMEILEIISSRHGRLPEFDGRSLILTGKFFFEIACFDQSAILSIDLARLNVKARRFWRVVFAIAELFTSGAASSWNDVPHGYTLDCLKLLEECIPLLSQWKESDRQAAGDVSRWASSAMASVSQQVVPTLFSNSPVASSGMPGQGEFPHLTETIQRFIVNLHDEMIRNEGDEAFQLVSRNEMNCLCGVLVRLSAQDISDEAIQAMQGLVLRDARGV